MKTLGLVLARGGSKRLPRKNIRILGRKPLIAWTLESAKNSHVFHEIMVSTDDVEIAAVAGEWGGYVPWLRPKSLATDVSSSMDALLHAVDWYENNRERVDAVMLLQPTTPFRSITSIQLAVERFMAERLPVVSVSPTRTHPDWCFYMDSCGGMVPISGWQAFKCRSQDLRPTYELNGMLYIASPDFLRRERTFLTDVTRPLIVEDSNEAIDIDTEQDWERAEAVACR